MTSSNPNYLPGPPPSPYHCIWGLGLERKTLGRYKQSVPSSGTSPQCCPATALLE